MRKVTCGFAVAKTLVCATVEDLSVIGLETAKCVAELVAESTSHTVALLTRKAPPENVPEGRLAGSDNPAYVNFAGSRPRARLLVVIRSQSNGETILLAWPLNR